MENLLKNLGRFIGEKFSLLDTVFLRKEDYHPDRKTNFTVNGYLPMLPPRPVEGDAYILEPSAQGPYRGIYYLNFGRNKREDGTFQIIGDPEAKAQGNGATANAGGDGIVSGLIPLSAAVPLRIGIAFSEPETFRAVAVNVDQYNAEGGLLRSSSLAIQSAYYPSDFVPAAGTASVGIRLRGKGGIIYLKVWEKMPSGTSLHKIYRFRHNTWQTENVPEGQIVAVKGKTFSLVKTAEGFRTFSNVSIPKLCLREGVADINSFMTLKEAVPNDNYYLRIFVRRRRLCKNAERDKVYKNKYWECRKKRVHNPSAFPIRFAQPADIALSRVRQEGKMIGKLSWKWLQLANTVFTIGKDISVNNSKRTFNLLKHYPSTGLYNKDRHRKAGRPEYADLAICLSKRVNKHFVDGEKTYFRLAVKNSLAKEVVVKVRER